MTRLLTVDSEGGADGATATAATTGFGIVTGDVTHVTTPADAIAAGTKALKFGPTVSGNDRASGQLNVGSLKSLLHITWYEYLPAAPVLAYFTVSTNASGTARNSVRINTDRTVALRNGASAVWTSTAVLPTLTRLRFQLKIDATNSVQSLSVFLGHSLTPIAGAVSGNQTYTQGTINTVIRGVTAAAIGITTYGDYFAVDDADVIGPVGVENQPPTVSIAASQSGENEPGSTVTLTVTATDPDGTISNIVVNQISGTPTVALTTVSPSVKTFVYPFTANGTALTFTATATDNSGASVTSAPTTVAGYPAPIQAPSASTGLLAPTDILVPAVAAITTRGLGYIGDTVTYQDNSTEPRDLLIAAGWPESLLEVDGLPDRTLALAGLTHPNVGEVIDTWRGRGFDPYTWVIALGTHNLGSTDAQWTTMIGQILDKIAEGPRAGYVVNFPGISIASAASPVPPRFIAVLNALVGTRAKITLKPLNWNAEIHNGQNETGLWDTTDSFGRRMTPAGYDIRNAYITAQVGAPT